MWGFFIDKIQTSFMAQHHVEDKLNKAISNTVKSTKEKLDTIKDTLRQDKTLSKLLTSCSALEKQLDEIAAFMQHPDQLSAVSAIFYAKAKSYGSIEKLKVKLIESPAIDSMKKKFISLLSSEIYDEFLPIAKKIGEFDQLSRSKRASVAKLLQGEELKNCFKGIDLSKTFDEFKKCVDELAKEFELSEPEHASLIQMVNTIEKHHLKPLQEIKASLEAHLEPVMIKLHKELIKRYPDLAINKSKEVIHAGKRAKKGTTKEETVPAKVTKKKRIV